MLITDLPEDVIDQVSRHLSSTPRRELSRCNRAFFLLHARRLRVVEARMRASSVCTRTRRKCPKCRQSALALLTKNKAGTAVLLCLSCLYDYHANS